MIRALSIALLLAVAPPAPAQEPAETAPHTLVFPRIASAGGVYGLPDGAGLPAADAIHRLLIDATGAEVTASGSNRHLEAAARAVNLYALAGVPPENVRIAMVVHGKATTLVLSDSAYRQRFGKPSPDAALVAALHDAGVRIHVCGQALLHQGFAVADVHEDVAVALSAMTKLVELQADGYGLIP